MKRNYSNKEETSDIGHEFICRSYFAACYYKFQDYKLNAKIGENFSRTITPIRIRLTISDMLI